MKKIIKFTILLLLLSCPSILAIAKGNIDFEILDEQIVDAPLKTEIVQQILIKGNLSKETITRFIWERYNSLKNRHGFKFHSSPTNIGVYLYISKEHYNSGMGQWIAMIYNRVDKSNPKVIYSMNFQGQLESLSAKPEDKFGLSEEQRKAILKELVVCEEKSWEKAEKVYALPESLNYSKEWGRAQLLKRAIFQEKLYKKYSEEVAKKHELTLDQLKEISLEGMTKDWPVNIDESIWRTSYEVTERQIKELMSETEREIVRREKEEEIRRNRPLPQISTKEDLVLDLNKGTLGKLRVGDSFENNEFLFKAIGGPPDNVYFTTHNYYYKRGFIVEAGRQMTTGRNIIFEIIIFLKPMNFSDDWMVQFKGEIIPSLNADENKSIIINKFGHPFKETYLLTNDLIYKKPYGRLTFSCNKESGELERIILDMIKD